MAKWDIPVLYEDEELVAVNKPPGIPSQAAQGPKRPNLYGLLQEVRGEKLYLHHRLDKDTSGVLILARHPRANKGLTETFREHNLKKTYWAITKKNLENDEVAEFIQPHPSLSELFGETVLALTGRTFNG